MYEEFEEEFGGEFDELGNFGEDLDELFEREFRAPEERNELRSEVNAFERAGPSGKLSELLSGVAIPDDSRKMSNIPPEDRFLIFTDAIARKIKANDIYPISEKDINELLERAVGIPNLQYKNPIAYILGYLASQGGRSLRKTDVLAVINNVLPKLGGEGSVEPPDVIRYARYWNLHM